MKRRRGINYALVTGTVAVAGLVVLPALFTSGESVWSDFLSNRLTYVYIFVATALTLLVLGNVLGRKADELRSVSATDPVTRLCHRRALDRRLRIEWRRSARYHVPLALLLIDIDGLKRINDERGHGGGDDLLRSTATSIRHSLRATDVGARLGGDEFAILAPQTTQYAAQRLAERLLAHLKNEKERTPGGITASVGVAVFDGQGAENDPEWLMRRAEEALYSAKSGMTSRITTGTLQVTASSSRGASSTLGSLASQNIPNPSPQQRAGSPTENRWIRYKKPPASPVPKPC